MPGRTAFFDASAVVPLCVAQPSSQRARQAYRTFKTQVVGPTTMVEAASAVYRAVRLGELAIAGATNAVGRLAQLYERWIEIEFTDRVQEVAIDALSHYALRAGHAIQLASALLWCKERPRNRPFVCFDKILSAAALEAGFDVIGLP